MRFVAYVLCVGMLPVVLTGCPKLVRQKSLKKEDLVPIYTFDDSYDLKTTQAQYAVYDKNFNYWKAAHKELMDGLSTNVKRREAYYTYAYDYVKKMQSLLPKDMAVDLDVYVQRYERMKSALLLTTLRDSQMASLKSRLYYLMDDIVDHFSPRQSAVMAHFDIQHITAKK